MSIRDIKRRARLELHRRLSVPALYIPAQGVTPIPCAVRVHTKFGALGEPEMAQRVEVEPKLVFLVSELPAPLRVKTGKVSVEAGEAYLIEAVEPRDDITITARVSRLSEADATGLPLPVESGE